LNFVSCDSYVFCIVLWYLLKYWNWHLLRNSYPYRRWIFP